MTSREDLDTDPVVDGHIKFKIRYRKDVTTAKAVCLILSAPGGDVRIWVPKKAIAAAEDLPTEGDLFYVAWWFVQKNSQLHALMPRTDK